MGVILKQNKAVTVKLLLEICKLAEQDWEGLSDEEEKRDIKEMISFMLMGFCAALRGKEVPLVPLEGLLHLWEETRLAVDPHIMLTLRGRFKGEQGLHWYCALATKVARQKIRKGE